MQYIYSYHYFADFINVFFAIQKPQCRDLSNQRKAVRRRALPDLSLALNMTNRMAEVDVRSQQLDVLDTQLGTSYLLIINFFFLLLKFSPIFLFILRFWCFTEQSPSSRTDSSIAKAAK